MDFHRHDHRKQDGRSLYLYSREKRDYTVTNDVEGPYAPNPHLRWHPPPRRYRRGYEMREAQASQSLAG